MRKLALEFGISDVGLAKICRKSGIPLPGLGHWKLVETGHSPERKPLPASEPGQHETITIAARTPESHSVLRKTNIGPVPNVEVNLDREIIHPLAIRTKRAFHATSKNERGNARSRRGHNKVFPTQSFQEKTDEFLRKLTPRSGRVLGLTKRAVDRSLYASVIEGISAVEQIYFEELMKTKDTHEGLSAFLEKRSPIWKNE